MKTNSIAALTLLLLTASCGPSTQAAPTVNPESSASPLSSKPAPEFKRPTLAGTSVDTAGLKGRVVVVKFFAEYCEPCTRTLPAAQALHVKYPEVAFIGVSEDENQVAAARLVDTYGLTFDVVLDRGNVLSGRFRISDLPHTFVIGPEGRVEWVGGPGAAEGDLEGALLGVLDANSP